MIVSDALHSTSYILFSAEIDDAIIEAELLLCHILGMSKAQLYGESETLLTEAEARHLRHLIQRRLLHEPTAYILGQCEFYGFNFYLDQRTLIPRPETEFLVEEAIKIVRSSHYLKNRFIIADIGTGCGAIAISLALTLPEVNIYAADISASALQVADINCRRHGIGDRVKFLQGDLLEPLPEPVDVIVANLPYIKNCELKTLSPEILNFEPIMALAGGEDGLDKIRCLLTQAPGKICFGGCLLMEVGQGQDKVVRSMVSSHFSGASIELIPDLGGINRVVKVML